MGMASELFLGPDGGPYVSVNESSGDMELKDNSGNVVAFWDESNTQWDLNSNDIQNVGSLSTEDLNTGVAEIDDSDSPYTTSGENVIEADTSGGTITINVASGDIPTAGNPAKPLTIINTGSNDLTIQGEGAETVEPGGQSSITPSADNAFIEARLIAGKIYVDLEVSREQITLENDNNNGYQEIDATQHRWQDPDKGWPVTLARHVSHVGITPQAGDNMFLWSLMRNNPTDASVGLNIAKYRFEAITDAGNGKSFATLFGRATDIGDSSFTGQLRVELANNGSLDRALNWDVENELFDFSDIPVLIRNALGMWMSPTGEPGTGGTTNQSRAIYVSDGSDGNNEGELVAVRNDDGTAKSQVIAANADDSA